MIEYSILIVFRLKIYVYALIRKSKSAFRSKLFRIVHLLKILNLSDFHEIEKSLLKSVQTFVGNSNDPTTLNNEQKG